MSEVTDKIEIHINEKINKLEDDKCRLGGWCIDYSKCVHQISVYQTIKQWMIDRPLSEVSDVVEYLSANITRFENERKLKSLDQAIYNILIVEDVYREILDWLWIAYPKEMKQIYHIIDYGGEI